MGYVWFFFFFLFLITGISRLNNLEITVFQAARLLSCHCRLVFKLFHYFYNALDTFAPNN